MYLQNLKQDEIYVSSEKRNLEELTGYPSRRGLENVIISNNKIVNTVSNSYGHIPNELFFKEAENKMNETNLNFLKQTINREDCSFVMEFILKGKNQFTVNNEMDTILPMIRFKNSYDGTEKTSGHFGFYRMVCSNGLHVVNAQVQFSFRHTKNNAQLVLPNLEMLFDKFIDKEYYGTVEKFNRLQKVKILDTKMFVKEVLERTKLFKYECSDTNEEPSKKSRKVIELLTNEAILFNEEPNYWLGYNAFNNVLHNSLKKTFTQQEKLDKLLLEEILEMV